VWLTLLTFVVYILLLLRLPVSVGLEVAVLLDEIHFVRVGSLDLWKRLLRWYMVRIAISYLIFRVMQMMLRMIC
jgi:hypothetical protein